MRALPCDEELVRVASLADRILRYSRRAQQPHATAELDSQAKAALATGRMRPVGRLDKRTTGLLLATDDGDLAYALNAPGAGCRKAYEAKVRCASAEMPSSDQLSRLTSPPGVILPDGLPARALSVTVVRKWTQSYRGGRSRLLVEGQSRKEARRQRRRQAQQQKHSRAEHEDARPDSPVGASHQAHYCTLRLEIDVGRYHVVRRLLAAVGLPVDSLSRIAIGTLRLGELPIPRAGWCAQKERFVGQNSARLTYAMMAGVGDSCLLGSEQVDSLWDSAGGRARAAQSRMTSMRDVVPQEGLAEAECLAAWLQHSRALESDSFAHV
eukprot:scaffold7631_cov376-Prasinococcus_capsulatus_cf.AAC.1